MGTRGYSNGQVTINYTFTSYISYHSLHVNVGSRFVTTRGDQKVRGKVLLYHIPFIDCNENAQIETTIHSKLTEIEIQKM